jgi:hypothetical protein
MDRKMIAVLVVFGLFLYGGAGPAFAAETVDGLPQSVVSQWGVAELAFSLATAAQEDPAGEEDPAGGEDPAGEEDPAGGEDPAGEEDPTEEIGDGDLEDSEMDPAKAMELAERHAFIGMAHLLGIPASRNIQNDQAWTDIWNGVLEQVATGEVTLSEALASVETEDNALLGVSPANGLALGKTATETTQLMASVKEKKEKEDKEKSNNGNGNDKDKSNNGNDKDKSKNK